MPVDRTLWSWGSLRGQAKERKVEFTEGDTGPCGAAFTATLGKCQGTGRMQGTLTTWCIVINEAHSWRKTLSFWKASILEKQPENPNVLEMAGRRHLCFLLSLPKGFLNITQHFLWPPGPSCLEGYNKRSAASHLASTSEPAVFRINWKKPWFCHK